MPSHSRAVMVVSSRLGVPFEDLELSVRSRGYKHSAYRCRAFSSRIFIVSPGYHGAFKFVKGGALNMFWRCIYLSMQHFASA